MVEGQEVKRRHGAATVLALLVSFLFASAPASAQAQLDRSARLGPAELVKRGVTTRTSIRDQSDDEDAGIALLPPPPQIRTESHSARPADDHPSRAHADAALERPLPYRARAPPAA